ncbi:YdeI/OmpD-associated family protein [Blastomonas sp. UPD001]|uniref:YdeI/OmpD-associated family protein n=1 Tax=Blastomonas sp. UPD001 TaxID=2217673 RepID=UPI0018E4E71D|nr:YdeI/OmpD-associated family protein [Blastomonas sp. UPD001]
MNSGAPIYPYSFEAPIEKFGVGRARKIWYNVLFLPDALRSELPFGLYPRLRVDGEIADVPMSNAFIPAGDGRNYVIVAPNVLADAGVTLGNQVEMRFRVADQDRVDAPHELLAALSADSEANELWQQLTPGRRRMVAQHVTSAKTVETGERRIQEALEAITKHGGDMRAWRKDTKASRQGDGLIETVGQLYASGKSLLDEISTDVWPNSSRNADES